MTPSRCRPRGKPLLRTEPCSDPVLGRNLSPRTGHGRRGHQGEADRGAAGGRQDGAAAGAEPEGHAGPAAGCDGRAEHYVCEVSNPVFYFPVPFRGPTLLPVHRRLGPSAVSCDQRALFPLPIRQSLLGSCLCRRVTDQSGCYLQPHLGRHSTRVARLAVGRRREEAREPRAQAVIAAIDILDVGFIVTRGFGCRKGTCTSLYSDNLGFQEIEMLDGAGRGLVSRVSG